MYAVCVVCLNYHANQRAVLNACFMSGCGLSARCPRFQCETPLPAASDELVTASVYVLIHLSPQKDQFEIIDPVDCGCARAVLTDLFVYA